MTTTPARGIRVADARRLLLGLPHIVAGRSYYHNYPAVLIRLADVPRSLLVDVVTEARRQVGAIRAARPRRKKRA